MKFLQTRTVLTIHRLQIAEHGGESGVRDMGLLDSALSRPINRVNYEPEAGVVSAAAAYAFGLARNHPFVDGNKRTALVAMETFLRINGCRLAATQEEKYLIFMQLAAGDLTEEELTEWIGVRAAEAA